MTSSYILSHNLERKEKVRIKRDERERERDEKEEKFKSKARDHHLFASTSFSGIRDAFGIFMLAHRII
jgi:hypothetical protein